MANEYVTSDALKATLDLTGETYADDDISAALASASRAVEDVCKRRFYPDADATQIRYYTPASSRLCRIDDLITLTELDVDLSGQRTYDTTLTAGSDFDLQPYNAAADGWPYTRLRAHLGRFPRCHRSMRVTGKFGWEQPPDNVVEATSLLASRFLRRMREAPFGVIGFAMETGSGAAAMIARSDPDVVMLLGPYVRRLSG